MDVAPRRAAGPLPQDTSPSWWDDAEDLFADPWDDVPRARRAAGVAEPEPAPELEPIPDDVDGPLPVERAAETAGHRRRSRLRLSALVGGVALLAAAGTALLPDQVVPLPTTPTSLVVEHEAAPARPADEPARPADRPARAAQPEGSPARFQSLAEVTTVAGVPEPCAVDLVITDDLSAAEITDRAEQQWGFDLTGPRWRQDEYRPVVKLFAETVDSVDCTTFLDRVKAGNGGGLEISSEPTRSWAWGDYGLTRARVLTLDFEKFRQGYADGDRGRLVRLVIHEMAHSLNADRFSEPAYWKAYNKVWNANGPVSDYGSNATESFADAVGYYVARCAADNPYDTTAQQPYYDYVKAHVFGGREFGGPVGEVQTCTIKGR